MDTTVLGPVVPEQKGAKKRKIVNLELTDNFKRKPTVIGTSREFNDQLYGGTILVQPYSCRRIVAATFVLSNRTNFVKGTGRDEIQRD